LGVPEVWLYKGEKIEFYKLYGEFYQETHNSTVFPMLSSKKASEFLRKGLAESSSKWFKQVREWTNKND
jgi:hypothetical protein